MLSILMNETIDFLTLAAVECLFEIDWLLLISMLFLFFRL